MEHIRTKVEVKGIEKQIEGIEVQVPVETFSVEEHRKRHGAGASVELKNEELRIQAFNDDRSSFPAWILQPLSK